MTRSASHHRGTSRLALALAAAALATAGIILLTRPSAPVLLDAERLRLVREPAIRTGAPPESSMQAEVLVVGGSLGGVAAALGACDSGRRVLLTEEGHWLGGQATAQAVSALDENLLVGHLGSTTLYKRLRSEIRRRALHRYRLSDRGQRLLRIGRFNPGLCWATKLAAQPEEVLAAIGTLLKPYQDSGRLRVLTRVKPYRAGRAGDRLEHVDFRRLDGTDRLRIRAPIVLDATDLGDLLPLAGVPFVTGAESRAQTGEPGAPADAPRPAESQPFSYPFVMQRGTAAAPPVPAPAAYDDYLASQPYSLDCAHSGRPPAPLPMFPPPGREAIAFWSYRRLFCRDLFAGSQLPEEQSLILWYSNDCYDGSLLDPSPARVLASLRRARAISFGFAHWLQADVLRPDGGRGYPELRLCPEATGTADGLSLMPYVREARRIVPLRRLTEQDVSARLVRTARAPAFRDAVCLVQRGIDIHAERPGRLNASQKTRPFQVPLGALLAPGTVNLLPASKSLGTTHVTNGACRMHLAEWSIGEAAGRVAAFCAARAVTPWQVHADPRLLDQAQGALLAAGVPLTWYTDVPQRHPAFAATQRLALRRRWPGDPHHLQFRPDAPITLADARALLKRARVPATRQARILKAAGLADAPQVPRARLAVAWDALDAPAPSRSPGGKAAVPAIALSKPARPTPTGRTRHAEASARPLRHPGRAGGAAPRLRRAGSSRGRRGAHGGVDGALLHGRRLRPRSAHAGRRGRDPRGRQQRLGQPYRPRRPARR